MTNYDLLGDIIVALNAIDQAQSQFPRGSEQWHDLKTIYLLLDLVEMPVKQEPYAFSGPFAYSRACTLCRQEVAHTEGEHLVLSRGIEVQSC